MTEMTTRDLVKNLDVEHGQTARGAARFVPLAGLLFVGLSVAGNLTIGPFPEGNTPLAQLTAFYTSHHAQVAAGGLLLGWAAIPFVFFGTAIWSRVHRSSAHPLVSAAVLIGTTLVAAEASKAGGTYYLLGHIGANPAMSPSALQALHIPGSEGSPTGGGIAVLLFAIAAAGLLAGAFPRSLALSALVIAILMLTPIFFLASLLFLLWVAVASIVMLLRPTEAKATGTDRASARFADTV